MSQSPSSSSTMSTPSILRRLYSLDTSSPDLSRHLYCLIRHDEWERYLSNLQGPKLARLVDFLDQVRTHPPALYQRRNRLSRPSMPFPQTPIFLGDVSGNYKKSVATARPFHRHMSYQMESSERITVRSLLVPSPMYGKGPISLRRSPSSV